MKFLFEFDLFGDDCVYVAIANGQVTAKAVGNDERPR